MPDTTLTSAVNELKTHQTQLDMDGVMVGVSRQALDIVLEALARAGLEAGKAEESMRESVPALMAKLPALPKDLFEMYPGMSANSHEHEVKRYAATAIRALPLTGVDKP